MPNEPLYPFGFGLSYTTFAYGEPKASKTKLNGDEKLTVSINITNTGSRAGEEVVQLYLRDVVASITRPVKELKAFKKVMLQPGESQEVSFTITTEMLSFYNYKLDYAWEPGEFQVMLGGSSDQVKSLTVEWLKP